MHHQSPFIMLTMRLGIMLTMRLGIMSTTTAAKIMMMLLTMVRDELDDYVHEHGRGANEDGGWQI